MKFRIQKRTRAIAFTLAAVAILLLHAIPTQAVSERLRELEVEKSGAANAPTSAPFNDSPEFRASVQSAVDENNPGTSLRPDLGRGCTIFSTEFFGCAIYWIFDTITDFITTVFVSLASLLFNGFVRYSLINPATSTFVKTGFSITASVADMFFILILLWIAIATILDYEEYSYRPLLFRLIIAALFINFSLPIGSAFIGFSNGVAKIFYDQTINYSGDGIIPGTGIAARVMNMSKIERLIDTTPDPEGGALEPRRIAEGSGLNLWDAMARMLHPFTAPQQSPEGLYRAFQSLFWKLLTVPILIFVLLAGSVMLLIRTLALSVVLVLGPLAFLFMILPATRRYSTEWWSALMKWSFFFPAFMFFLMLSLTTGSSLGGGMASESGRNIGVLPQYLLTVGLLVASLVVAQKMGITGANAFMGWGKKMGGKVGTMVKNAGIRTVLGVAAPVAKKLETGTGRIAQTLNAVPGVTRAAQMTAAAQRQKVGEREKQLEKYNDDELKKIIDMRGTTDNARVAALKILAKHKELRGIDAEKIKPILETMQAVGEGTGSIERQRPDTALVDPQKKVTHRRLDPQSGQFVEVKDEPTTSQELATKRVTKLTSAEDYKNMDESVVTKASQAVRDAFIEATLEHIGPDHLRQIVNRNDEMTEAVTNAIAGLGDSAEDIAAALRARGNNGLARYVASPFARTLLGIPSRKEKATGTPPGEGFTPETFVT